MRCVDRSQTIDSIIRLAQSEDTAPPELRSSLREVRKRLEDSLGGTARPAEVARILSVSQPALKRWLDNGEIPTVVTPDGRREVPLGEVLALATDVEAARQSGRERALSAVIRERRRDAAKLDVDALLPPRRPRRHRQAELQALAYHREVARRLTPKLVGEAKDRIDRWEKQRRLNPYWANEWRRVLERPLREVAKTISSDTTRSRELRQTSPFAGVLTEQERRRLLETVESRR